MWKKIFLFALSFLILINISYAEIVRYDSGRTFNNNQPGTGKGWCWNFEVTEAFALVGIVKDSQSTWNLCEVLTFPAYELLATAVISGTDCNLTTELDLNASTMYSFCAYGNSTWTDYFWDSGGNYAVYPIAFEKGILQNETFQATHGDTGTYSVDSRYFQAIDAILINNGTEEGPSQATLTLYSNLANTSNINENFNITWNGTTADTAETVFNCTLYNFTDEVYSAEVTIAQNTGYYFEVAAISDDYEFWVECDNNGINDSTTKHFYEVDAVLPELGLDTDFYNHSSFYQGSYLNFWYSWQDSNFLASNLTLFDVDRTTVLDNQFTENASNEGFYDTYSYLLGDSGFNYTIRLEAWDSHTGEILLYDVVQKNDSYLEYNNVKIISDAVLDYEQESDKVSLTLSKTASYLCYETTGEWIKIENSKYPNHYVDIDNRVWVDDYANTLVMETPQRLCTEEIKSVDVKSIGDLNYVSYTYFFDIVSLDTLYLESIDDNIGLIYGVMSMIPLLFLWIFIYTAAMILMLNFNFVVGSILWYFNYFLDFFVISEFFNLYTAARTGADWYVWAYGMFFVGLIIWLVIKLYIPFMLKQPRRT